MKQQGTLAFFQNFYTDVSLYVVPEAVTAAPVLTPPVEAASLPPAAAPIVAPPTPPAAPVVSAAPAGPGKLPALNDLPGTAPAPTPVVPAPRPEISRPPVTAPVAPAAPPAPAVPPVLTTPYSTLGSNTQGVVILVRLDAVRFQRLPRNVFLNNVLKAIRLVVEDVTIVNVESHLPVALSNLRQHLAARQIIGFGKNLLDVAVRTTQLYEPVILAGDAAYLPAAEIEVIEEDTGRKKLLWKAMQRMFLA